MELLITLGFIFLYMKSTLKTALIFVLITGSFSLMYAYFFKQDKLLQYVIYFTSMALFASFTFIFDDPKIYMLKTTFSFSLLALALILWPVIRQKTLFEETLSHMRLEKKYHQIIQPLSIFVALSIAGVNTYVVYNYDIYFWGKFKVALAFMTTAYTTICFYLLCQTGEKAIKESENHDLS